MDVIAFFWWGFPQKEMETGDFKDQQMANLIWFTVQLIGTGNREVDGFNG